jgi:Na+/H+-dicarboxylate symporter
MLVAEMEIDVTKKRVRWFRRLHWQVLLALLAGVGFGLLAVAQGWQAWSRDWVTPFGVIFMNLLKMVALPMMAFSLIVGVCSVSDVRKIARLGGKMLLWFVGTMLVAVLIGVLFASVLRPGEGMPGDASERLIKAYEVEVAQRGAAASALQEAGPLRLLVAAVPDNLVGAFGDNSRMLQVVVAALMLGLVLAGMGEVQRRPLLEFCESAAALFTRLAMLVAALSPVGVFALMTTTVVVVASDDLWQAVVLIRVLGMYMLTVILALALHQFGFYSLVIALWMRRSPGWFFRGIAPSQWLCFSTASTSACLPVTIECCEKNLGVPRRVARFVLPVATTLNMDGSALFQAVATLFIAQVFGVDLSWGQVVLLFGITLFSAIGTAPVPGSSLVMLVMVLTTLDLPVEGLGLVVGVDRVLNMCRSTVNAVGDAVIAVLLSGEEEAMDGLET